MTEQQREVSNDLFNLANQLTDMGVRQVDKVIAELCATAGISYPPEQKKVSQHLLTLAN